MFPYFSSLKAAPGSDTGAFRVVADGYVTADAGTGIVHQAPFFGEDDYRVCRKFGELHSWRAVSDFLQRRDTSWAIVVINCDKNWVVVVTSCDKSWVVVVTSFDGN